MNWDNEHEVYAWLKKEKWNLLLAFNEDDIELAILANNMGSMEFKEEYCKCDPSVGMCPCPYCAIDTVLRRLLNIAKKLKGEV